MTALVHSAALPAIAFGETCDACLAQARVRVRLLDSGRRLDFCKHHFEKHEAAVMPLIDAIQDQRDELSVKLGVGMAPGQDAVHPSLRDKPKGKGKK